MLEDSRELTASMTWSKAVAVFENDKRYKAVDRASDREDLFQSYCADQQKKYHEDKSRVEGALNLKKVTVLTTWTFGNFKAAIGKDIISSLSYYNLQRVFEDLIKMEKEKEKELKKRQRLAKDFTELLNNMEEITESSTWESCHHLLREKSEYRAISDEIIARETFEKHVACLVEKGLVEKAQKKRKREDKKARKEKERERLKKDDSEEEEEDRKHRKFRHHGSDHTRSREARKEKERERLKTDDSEEEEEDRKHRKFHHHGSDHIRSREYASSRDSRKYHPHSSDRENRRQDASSRDSRKSHCDSSYRENTRKDASSRDSRKSHHDSSYREKTRKDSYSDESDSERKHKKKHKKDSRYYK